jgi:hypothetical protein
MNPPIQKLGAIGLSLLGVWAILQAVSQLAFYLPVILTEESDYLGWEQVFSPVVHALLGGALISGRTGLAKSLFPQDVEVELDTTPPNAEFLVALLGVWLAVTSIARAAQVELNLFNQFSMSSGFSYYSDKFSFMMTAEAWSQRAPYLITLAFGIFLVVGSRGLTRIWLTFRAAGRDR